MTELLAVRVVGAFLVEYSSNNSGGGWWLKDEDWQRLEQAGWYVNWLGRRFCGSSFGKGGAPAPHTCDKCQGHRGAESFEEAVAYGEGARWLGALATDAYMAVTAVDRDEAEMVATDRWRKAVYQDPDEPGCSCCGQPHNFYAR